MVSEKFWKRMKNVQRIHRLLYALGLGPLIGKIILLLTTTGRKSGQLRVTPLQYEEIAGKLYLGSARGVKADWVQNILADPRVQVRLKNRHFNGHAQLITDASQFADFLEIRLQRHPKMVGLMMEKAHHLPRRPTRQQLEALAATEALVVIMPDEVP